MSVSGQCMPAVMMIVLLLVLQASAASQGISCPAHRAGGGRCFGQYFYSGQTAAAVYRDSRNVVVRCDVVDLSHNSDFIRQKREQHYDYEQISVTQMLHVLLECQPLDSGGRKSSSSPSSACSCNNLVIDESVHPICDLAGPGEGLLVPGTLWCGPGCNATDWSQLGSEEEVDRCCRTHDLCPRRRGAAEITDSSVKRSHTMLDCRCDKLLLSCLDAQHSELADFVADVYQLVQHGQCIH